MFANEVAISEVAPNCSTEQMSTICYRNVESIPSFVDVAMANKVMCTEVPRFLALALFMATSTIY